MFSLDFFLKALSFRISPNNVFTFEFLVYPWLPGSGLSLRPIITTTTSFRERVRNFYCSVGEGASRSTHSSLRSSIHNPSYAHIPTMTWVYSGSLENEALAVHASEAVSLKLILLSATLPFLAVLRFLPRHLTSFQHF